MIYSNLDEVRLYVIQRLKTDRLIYCVEPDEIQFVEATDPYDPEQKLLKIMFNGECIGYKYPDKPKDLEIINVTLIENE